MDQRIAAALAEQRAGRPDEAERLYQLVLSSHPDNLDALLMYGQLLMRQRRHEPAILHLRRASEVSGHPAALSTYAQCLFQLRRYREVLEPLSKVLASGPPQPRDLALLWLTHCFSENFAAAIDALGRFLALVPHDPVALLTLYHCRAKLGMDNAALEPRLLSLLDNPALSQHTDSMLPLYRLETAADLKRVMSRIIAMTAPKPAGLPQGRRPAAAATRKRYRVVYFSSDFRWHATAILTAGLFEAHDRERFDIHLVQHSIEERENPNLRIRAAAETFHYVPQLNDDDLAAYVQNLDADVLVDLNGFTAGNRLGVLSRRPAPVIVNWLGFACSMYLEYFDYIIADPAVIPAGAEAYYAEKVIRLPRTYQPNDSGRRAGETRSRREYGLPEHGVVFCSFNRLLKITEAIFQSWMALLARVPDSVLWLLAIPPDSAAHLRQRAAAAGIDPDRIVLAGRATDTEHLARYRAADLALDTYPYGSHTTASDALWMGCPFIGIYGDSFASRVSLSLLKAAGLERYAVADHSEAVAMAARIASDPAELAAVRADFARAPGSALFDAALFAREMETALAAAIERNRQGLAPAHIDVGLL